MRVRQYVSLPGLSLDQIRQREVRKTRLERRRRWSNPAYPTLTRRLYVSILALDESVEAHSIFPGSIRTFRMEVLWMDEYSLVRQDLGRL